ncbi:septum formation inhibitor Maf [Verticiella sediminum]|uniref:dTTP/UTP pyrophosphatase n=1 Tax=Verticiella sediminum TaxID=1247510 RepID=A0A556AZH3_9BURK|nr:nucleoside triphosphate pyrophosphatase [Verticiella sediminum]TSH98342.1 septum formation inhibitor Maf [Verticiella sediminum]
MTAIYLASRSPRRRELLSHMRVPHDVLVLAATEDDEPRLPGESPADYVVRTAREKAQRGVVTIRKRGLAVRPVLAADTTVILGDDVLGKPADRDEAAAMLGRLSGTRHEVRTALALAALDGRLHEDVSITTVQFRPLSARDIARYCDSGEPYDKAGAYGIQGLAGIFVERIEGSYTGVMGLPLFETARLLNHVGITLP